ncbi:MAG: NADH:ubiquinone reductase (Na(+)-transporting) subunit B, partial [Planctomycetota bacterium]
DPTPGRGQVVADEITGGSGLVFTKPAAYGPPTLLPHAAGVAEALWQVKNGASGATTPEKAESG